MTLFVKICGLRTEQDVDTAVEAGADAIGFVFSDSPRRIDPATAARLAARVPESVVTVGVFRREPLEYVRSVAAESGIGAVQLHGPEDRDYYAELASGGWTLIRAAAFGDSVPRCGELGEDMLLLDAPVPGSGIAWDWSRKQGPGPGRSGSWPGASRRRTSGRPSTSPAPGASTSPAAWRQAGASRTRP